jgi:hypothetical protein
MEDEHMDRLDLFRERLDAVDQRTKAPETPPRTIDRWLR